MEALAALLDPFGSIKFVFVQSELLMRRALRGEEWEPGPQHGTRHRDVKMAANPSRLIA